MSEAGQLAAEPLSDLAKLYAPPLEDELRRIVPAIACGFGQDPGPILKQLLRSPAAAHFVAALLNIQAREKKVGRPPWSNSQDRAATTMAVLRAQGLSDAEVYKRAREELHRERVYERRPTLKHLRSIDKRARGLALPDSSRAP